MGEPTENAGTNEAGRSLTASLASDGLDLAASVGDVGLEAVLESGALDGVPFFGLLNGLRKAGRHIPAILYQRKAARMLAAVAEKSTLAQRKKFAEGVSREGEAERFGEVMLTFIDKADEIEKPALIGRIMAAHIRGDLDRVSAYRIGAMINRAYFPDLERLKTFRYGTGAPDQHIYMALAAVGFLTGMGFEGGEYMSTDPHASGGDLYALNDLGTALLRFGFEIELVSQAGGKVA